MSKVNKREVIDIGYHIFALEGPEHIDERVAQEVHLKRNEFHNQFGAEENFIEELLSHHIELVDEFLEEAAECKSWDPDLIQLLVHFKTTILFNRQLKLQSNNPIFQLTFNRISYLVQSQVFDIWRKFTNMQPHLELSRELYEVMRDIFHSRITNENLNYEYLKALATEFRTLIEKLIKLEQTVLKGN